MCPFLVELTFFVILIPFFENFSFSFKKERKMEKIAKKKRKRIVPLALNSYDFIVFVIFTMAIRFPDLAKLAPSHQPKHLFWLIAFLLNMIRLIC